MCYDCKGEWFVEIHADFFIRSSHPLLLILLYEKRSEWMNEFIEKMRGEIRYIQSTLSHSHIIILHKRKRKTEEKENSRGDDDEGEREAKTGEIWRIVSRLIGCQAHSPNMLSRLDSCLHITQLQLDISQQQVSHITSALSIYMSLTL